MKRVRAPAALLVLASSASAHRAWASNTPPPMIGAEADPGVGISYEAPAQCPDASAFMERVRARTAQVDLATGPDVARVVVIVSSTDAASSARIQFTGADAPPASRTVSGRTCDEVVSAAALITALAIDAALRGAPPPAQEPPEPSSPISAPRDAASPAPSEPRSSGLRGPGFGAMGGLVSWLPGGGYFAGVFGEVAADTPFDLVRLMVRATTASASVDARSATFSMLTAQLSLCPLSLRMAESFVLATCAGVDVGRLAGEGEASPDLRTPRSAAIFWSSAIAELLARWQLGSQVVLEAGGELGFPLVRHTFAFEGPTQTVYEVPAVGGGVHIAFALHFR